MSLFQTYFAEKEFAKTLILPLYVYIIFFRSLSLSLSQTHKHTLSLFQTSFAEKEFTVSEISTQPLTLKARKRFIINPNQIWVKTI